MSRRSARARFAAMLVVGVAGLGLAAAAHGQRAGQSTAVNDAAAVWIRRTLESLTIDEKIGQLIVPAMDSAYLSADSDRFDRLAHLVTGVHVGGFQMFGATEPAPAVLLDPHYSTVRLGQPLEAAAILNRLQSLARVPLLNSADFETGPGFRLAGATRFPRQMAFGAAGDDAAVREAARITAEEARAVGVAVNLAPVADVNSNPRNPVINTRSFGEDPARVSQMVAAFVAGTRAGGGLAVLKHFPGHGDADTDTHLGLAVLPHDRSRLDAIELKPFRAGIEHGAPGVMTSHLIVPAIDGTAGMPATFSGAVTSGLLRRDLAFSGLVYTDSLSMAAVASAAAPGEVAVRAFLAGADQLLDPPDADAAATALKAAVDGGRITRQRLDESVTRILRAKAAIGLDRQRLVDLDAVIDRVGTRAHAGLSQDVSARSVTLVKDEAGIVPLKGSANAPVLYLSVLDYPAGWGIAAPSRTFIPELKKRWPSVTAVEVSDQTSRADLALVRAMAPRASVIVAGVFVRVSSGSGRMDLAPELVALLNDLARDATRRGAPFVACLFGNPYVASALTDVPAMLLTYDLYDLPEASAVRALAGEAPIVGRLPVTIPGVARSGFGLTRAANREP